MADFSKKLVRFLAPIIARFAYFNAAIIFMILGERAYADKNIPPVSPYIIYGYCGSMVTCGLCMSHDLKRRQAALVFVGLAAFFGYALFAFPEIKYNEWLKVRLLVRVFGVMAVFTTYSMLMNPKKSRSVKRMGEGLFGLYSMSYAYLLVNSKEDRLLFESLLPKGDVFLFLLVILLTGCAMIYVGGGMFIFDAGQALGWSNIVLILTHCGQVHHWTSTRGTPLWIQMKLISEDIVITLGLFFMSFHSVYIRVPSDYALPRESGEEDDNEGADNEENDEDGGSDSDTSDGNDEEDTGRTTSTPSPGISKSESESKKSK